MVLDPLCRVLGGDSSKRGVALDQVGHWQQVVALARMKVWLCAVVEGSCHSCIGLGAVAFGGRPVPAYLHMGMNASDSNLRGAE